MIVNLYRDTISLFRLYHQVFFSLCNNGGMCSFWLNVKKSLVYKEMEIKDLAFRSGVSYSTIINGMNKNSMPHADIALKISRALNMSLEGLLGDGESKGLDVPLPIQWNLERMEIALYRKNKGIIDALEELPPQLRDVVVELVKRTRDSLLGE